MPPAPCAGSYIRRAKPAACLGVASSPKGLTRSRELSNQSFVTRLIYCGKLSSFGVKSELAERLTKPCSFDKPTGGTPAFVTWEKPDYKFGSPLSLHGGGSAFRLE